MKNFLFLLGINAIIAVLLTTIGFGGKGFENFIYSQCIGIAIFAMVKGGYRVYSPLSPLARLAAIFFCLAAGTVIGIVSAGLVLHGRIMFPPSWRGGSPVATIMVCLLLGAGVTYFFLSKEEVTRMKSIAQEERIKRLASENETLAMRMKLLQAQVEPHFLFNTLSNIHGLMHADKEKSGKMLLDLIHYLRSSLALSRKERVTVHDELEMIRAYLEIFRVRMGDRLAFRIEIEEGAQGVMIPSMLMQPLVENSIRHGLEPLVEGGAIEIRVAKREKVLEIRVDDTGCGIADTMREGFGLSSIRERIYGLYGGKGYVRFEENRPRGLKVTLAIPDA